MADTTINQNNTARDATLDAPKSISKPTWLMVAAAIIFIIIASILFGVILNAPTGTTNSPTQSGSSSSSSDSRANP